MQLKGPIVADSTSSVPCRWERSAMVDEPVLLVLWYEPRRVFGSMTAVRLG